MRQKAFTLIELLVVVAIIGILAAVGVVAYNGYTKSAKESAVRNNFKSVVKYINNELMKCELGEQKIVGGRLNCPPDAFGLGVYTKFIEEWLNTWTGYSEETQFEVNMLSVNENTILSMNYQKQVHDKLKEHKIEPIYCRFRHRNFWDGGLHCLTLDTVREGGMQSYF